MHPVKPIRGIGEIADEFIFAAKKLLTQRQQRKTKRPAQQAANIIGQLSTRAAI